MDEIIKVASVDEIATVTLNRASHRNAITQQMMNDLIAAADSLCNDTSIRAVIIRAEGDHFSVGADLKDSGNLDPQHTLLQARRDAELGAKLLRALRDIHAPTICAIQGIATGAGACIATACDYRIAANDARMGYGEVRMGMNLMWNAIPYVVELVGPSRAKQLVMSGELFPAEKMEHWGLLDETCNAQDLLATAHTWAEKYAALPPIAVQMIKRSINRYSQALGEAVMHMDSDQWLLTTRSDDFAESIAAFHDKRAPELKGK